MKKIITLTTVFILSVSLIISGCSTDKPADKTADGSALTIIATNFAGYDFARNVVVDKAQVSMLLPPGTESHTYEPSAQDIKNIQQSDLFIYVGGHGDAWVDKLLASIDNPTFQVIKMMDVVELLPEETVAGMQIDPNHLHEHEHEHADADEHEQVGSRQIAPQELSVWAGKYQALYPLLADGSLDDYIRRQAAAQGQSFEEIKSRILQQQATDYPLIEIAGDLITMTTASGTLSGKYSNAGVHPANEQENYPSEVWQIYKLQAKNNDMPTFIAFSCLEQHPLRSDILPHFSMLYGNDHIEKLLENNPSRPTFFSADAAPADIKASLERLTPLADVHYDEHVWTSPRNAMKIVAKINSVMCEIDPANKDYYNQQTQAYTQKLEKLDAEFREVAAAGKRKTIVFGDRFPLIYFVKAYGLDYYAAFPGCSTETEPSAATVAFLIDKIKNEKIPVVFHIELSNERMADTIAEATGARKLLFHCVHNVTKDQLEQNIGYLDFMENNVQALKEALN